MVAGVVGVQAMITLSERPTSVFSSDARKLFEQPASILAAKSRPLVLTVAKSNSTRPVEDQPICHVADIAVLCAAAAHVLVPSEILRIEPG